MQYAAARYDPATQTLNFNNRATKAFDGPWKLLWIPGLRRRLEESGIGVGDLAEKQGEWRDTKGAAIAVYRQ